MTSWIQLQGTVVFATQRFRLPPILLYIFSGTCIKGNLKSNGHLELLKLVQLSRRCALCIGFGNVGKDEDGTDGTDCRSSFPFEALGGSHHGDIH